jgi:alpha-beta hydrolase superfamily lysophospholipase
MSLKIAMQSNSFHFASPTGPQIFVRQWLPDNPMLRAVVLIAHGAAEHSARYQRVASVLTAEGYAVYAVDHRGHGQTAGSLAKAGNAGPDGFNGMIHDLKTLADLIRTKYEAAPLYLLGHSMGAALSQRFIQLHGELLSGVILSGSPGIRPNLEQAAAYTAQVAAGDKAEQVSELFKQSFASFNEGLGPIKSGYEWLSRDESEVQKYVDDPWCGFPFNNRLVAEMSQCAWEAAQTQNIAKIPKSLPIYLFAGTHDRVGGNGDYINRLATIYREAGVANVEVVLYPEGRHEMLNETNRDQVHRDLIAWLQKHIQ